MKAYTINGTRTTLYSIIQNVFTKTFINQYENNAAAYESSAECTMKAESERADFAIIQMSLYLDSPSELENLAKSLNPKTIFTIYLRYYMLSRYLERQIQSDKLELPEDKKDFFKYLLIDHWKKSLGY